MNLTASQSGYYAAVDWPWASLSAIPYAAAPVIALGVLNVIQRSNTPILERMEGFLDRWGLGLTCLAALAVLATMFLARVRLSSVSKSQMARYLGYWFAITAVVLLSFWVLWQGIREVPVAGISSLWSVLFISALLWVPLGRLSLAPTFLARNRHR